ncbi:DNA methyltransferase [Loktanella sp. SALINAS62]|uniref:class I SAM-dependent DNA methyltransferase n=1 Tax=Loktanella sp. SALINAS62 TaxID=2706124 RepID=UPI002013286D|nr:DNA methyltransferase [Loktanella sp. SALINAS62]MBS1302136.1 class I SAM-dependent DNA methyltransferase [Loktanella sp. SALINAS62]
MDAENPLEAFISKAKASGGAERANYQLFVVELCEVLGVRRPEYASEDTGLDNYVFERKVAFAHPDGSTTSGWIDCYRRDHFILEAKQSKKRTASADGLGLPSDTFLPKTGHALRGTRTWDRVMVQAKTQAESYSRTLPVEHGYPPFILIVDVGNVIEVFADFSGQGKNYAHFPDRKSFRILMDDLRESEIQDRLRAIWTDPHSLDPAKNSARITREIADQLAIIARRLERKHDAKAVAEFLMRCIFTMFAEDVKLLPERCFQNLLQDMQKTPGDFVPALESLWRDMDEGGFSGMIRKTVKKFNGSLFKDRTALPLESDELAALSAAANRDWQDVEPAIFGTLLERALDKRERSSLGAHYTPRAYVERLVVPVIIEPLREDWTAVQARVRDLTEQGKDRDALDEVRRFHRKLCTTRVLDPACGTGNFLYVSLELMKRLEGEVLDAIADLGGQPDRYSDFPDDAGSHRVGRKLASSGGRFTVDPHQFYGLELNPRAVPIADLVLWIGFLKWQIRTGVDISEPVLDAYGTIRQQDAVLAHDGETPALDENGQPRTRWDGFTRKPDLITGEMVPDASARVAITAYANPRRASWPDAEFIIGNPPFIGGKDIRAELGDGYAEAAWAARPDVPGGADFVMHFWDEAARRLTVKGTKAQPNPTRRFGFITTNSITQTFSRRVIEQRPKGEPPFSLVFAVGDHPWLKSADRAAVRIAMTVAEAGLSEGVLGEVVEEADLNTDAPRVRLRRTAGKITSKLTIGADLASIRPLWANEALSSPGVKLHGAGFIVSPEKARELGLGTVPGLQRHILPYRNGRDLAATPRGAMVIDLFGLTVEDVRDRFPAVFQHVAETVKPERDNNNRDTYRDSWWIFGEPRRDLRPALEGLPRYIATIETTKHRVFRFLDASIRPDNKLIVLAVDDTAFFSVLSSRLHVHWCLSFRNLLEDRPVYAKTDTFDPFPFPLLGEAARAEMSKLGNRLDTFRTDRIANVPGLTMTKLYNALGRAREVEAGTDADPLSEAEKDLHSAAQIAVLKDLHDRIDRAVFDAYGWSDLAPRVVGKPGGLTPSLLKTSDQEDAEEELLKRLVELNKERVRDEARGVIHWLRPEFQKPRLGAKAPQPATARQMEAELAAVAAPAEKIAWPKDGLEQIKAMRGALGEADGPISVADLDARFKGGRKRQDRIADLLAYMSETGMIRTQEGEAGQRYFIPM